ncbi:prolyl oligopeptidase family serine peptidase [bacterium]|nr:prolyl oligopeptidase family serine peptidase [bacterium]
MRFAVAVLALCLMIPAAALLAEDAEEKSTVPIDEWLVKETVRLVLPAFHDEKPGAFDRDDFLDAPSLDTARLRPHAGDDGWTVGHMSVGVGCQGVAETWLATYITSDRFLKAKLRLPATCLAGAWLDGVSVSLSGDEPEGELKLRRGTGLLLVRVIVGEDPDSLETRSVNLTAELVLDDENDGKNLSFSAAETRAVDIRDILDAPKVSSLALSPDGSLVALTLGAYGPDGAPGAWLEIRDTDKGGLVRTWRGAPEDGNVRWLPHGRAVSYTSSHEKKTTLWIYDLETERVRAALRDLEHFEGYAWNPDGRSLVYAYGVEAEADERKVKRLEAIEDRWPKWRNRSYLVEVTWPGGASRRLTAGAVSAADWTFSPRGTHLLFSRTWPDPLERPYARTEWFELDLGDLSVETVLTDRWIGQAAYGADRGTLVLVGSPSAFGGIGRDLPEGVVPNDYGGQLFLYDRGRGEPKPLSRDFDPTVQRAVWHDSGRIVARVLDKQYQRLATCTPAGAWTFYDAGVEVVADWEVSRGAKTVVATGTSATAPQKLTAFALKGREPRVLLDPGADRYADVTFGRVEPFVAKLADGMELDGRVYYPRDYDPALKYPAIVYYYGGTYPITRDFGGRYPKNVWAGQDYFVYVPNPSGALGYGQAFAARHVNDWGRLTAGEVIEGTRAFLAAHPAADGERLGCIGASYGGFLTMYLITRTDMFAAAVAHAGISSISSYWAEGYWGYAYGARALAGAFPWTDPDLYVGQSPLFSADLISTPLLLLHGSDDTNVPRGESDGLYIALKMLGKEVEYVQVEGQDHHILDHDRRITWNDTILAWFARELRDRPGWWDDLYPAAESVS